MTYLENPKGGGGGQSPKTVNLDFENPEVGGGFFQRQY